LSARLPWTKLQDFYLRLGFLKVLVASLSSERRSVTNDAIIRRLERPLFDAIGPGSPLAGPAEFVAVTTTPKSRAQRAVESVEVVETLVSDATLPSALYAVTRDTAYKIVDWGRDVDFLGRANQISERALLLQSLLPADRVRSFQAGDPTAWNPFVLSVAERLFFLFHALEHDLVTVQLIEDLAAAPADMVIEARGASQMTCGALFRMLEVTERLHDAHSIQEHRTALDLALTMADEVDAPVPTHWARHASRARLARETKATMRRSSRPGSRSTRKTTKNADHQTIPRFEQLVDLGFLKKPDTDGDDPTINLNARRRWRYVPTQACRRWTDALRRRGGLAEQTFKRCAFAAVAVESFSQSSSISRDLPSVEDVGRRIWHAYSAVGRSVGLSPVDSIALRAMLDSAAEGVVLEMESVHRLLLTIKQRALLSDSVMFAAGSTLDTMFVRIKPSFIERLSTAASDIAEEWNR
jgi:hypothetical protein